MESEFSNYFFWKCHLREICSSAQFDKKFFWIRISALQGFQITKNLEETPKNTTSKLEKKLKSTRKSVCTPSISQQFALKSVILHLRISLKRDLTQKNRSKKYENTAKKCPIEFRTNSRMLFLFEHSLQVFQPIYLIFFPAKNCFGYISSKKKHSAKSIR